MRFDKEQLLETLNLKRKRDTDLEEKRDTTARILTATGLFIGGAVVGAAVALLVTPKSGEDLRKDLKDLTADLKENVVEQRGNGQVESVRAQDASARTQGA